MTSTDNPDKWPGYAILSILSIYFLKAEIADLSSQCIASRFSPTCRMTCPNRLFMCDYVVPRLIITNTWLNNNPLECTFLFPFLKSSGSGQTVKVFYAKAITFKKMHKVKTRQSHWRLLRTNQQALILTLYSLVDHTYINSFYKKNSYLHGSAGTAQRAYLSISYSLI